MPRRWVALDRLPVNASGKLDRTALPEPGDDSDETPQSSPATALEKTLRDLWCEELEAGPVPVTTSFFELGGHSLSAIRLLNRMREEADVDLTMADFFLDPTIRGIATRHRVVDTAPMPSTLRRLWRRHHALPDPSVYNIAHRMDLRGDLDPEVLHQALMDLVARHHALRSRPARREDGRYEVEILAQVPVTLPITDLRAHAGDAEHMDRWCREQASTPFTLDQTPLFRFRLARLAEDHWVMVTVFHHAVCDGWSLSIIRRDLQELYNARRSGTAPQPLSSPPSSRTSPARNTPCRTSAEQPWNSSGARNSTTSRCARPSPTTTRTRASSPAGAPCTPGPSPTTRRPA